MSLPVVTASNGTVLANQSVLMSSLFSASDADGDPITQYRFWDDTNGGGFFAINGVAQPWSGSSLTISAAQLANTTYVGGPAAGSEVLWAKAFDGTNWGTFATWTMTTTASTNHAPVVTASNGTVQTNQAVPISSLFSVTDADGNAITQYRFWDDTNGGGFFAINGVAQPWSGSSLTISAAQLANTTYVGGPAAGSEMLWAKAFDGTDWGAFATWTMTTVGLTNRAPVVTASNGTVQTNQAVPISSLFSVTDADGNAITQYRFWDDTNGGGFFAINGVAQPWSGSSLTISAAQLANTTYVGGPTAGSEMLWAKAFDGTDWGAFATWTMTTVGSTNRAPVVTASNGTVQTNQAVPISSLFSVTDADGNAITQYRFWDDTNGGGFFAINGVAQPWSGSSLTISAAQLANTTYVGGPTAGSEMLWAKAFDGTDWGAFATWTMTTAASTNHAPVVTASNGTVRPNQAVPISSLFSVTDADGNAITQYRFWDDTNGGGFFAINGVAQPWSGSSLTISAAQLANTTYVGGPTAGSETLWAKAFDGTDWGAFKTWTMTTNTPPSVTANNYTLAAGTRWFTNTFFSAADADGNPISKVEVLAPPTSAGFGSFGTVNSITLGNPTTYNANSFDSFGLSMFTASPGSYAVSARAFDGVDWGALATSNITVVAPPVDGGGSSVGTAVQLTLGTPFPDWLGSGLADQFDFYKFTLPSPQNLHLQLSGYTDNTPGSAIAVTLQPLAGGSPIPGTSNVQTSGMTVDYSNLAAGQYLVQLTQPSSGQTFYNLTVS